MGRRPQDLPGQLDELTQPIRGRGGEAQLAAEFQDQERVKASIETLLGPYTRAWHEGLDPKIGMQLIVPQQQATILYMLLMRVCHGVEDADKVKELESMAATSYGKMRSDPQAMRLMPYSA